MKVIPPLAITDAMLTSTSAVETAPALYAGGTTYALNATAGVAGAAGLITIYKSLQGSNTGHAPASSPTWWVSIGTTYQVYAGGTTYALADRVIDNVAHLVYESLIGGNVGNVLSDGAKWKAIGPTNPWAMFDTLRNTATTVPAGTLTATITPGVRIDSLALLGLSATSATITVTVAGVTQYSKTVNLNLRYVANWYDYYFAPFKTQNSLVVFDIPPYSNGVITITLTNLTGNVACGACVMGMQVDIGDVQYSAESDALNFSTVDRTTDGTATLIPSRNVPKTISSIWLDKKFVNQARSLRDSLNGSTAVWAGLDDDTQEYFEALLILGFYRRFTINLQYPDFAIISLELEEV
ncbi:hypothetical protein D0T21_09415 [Duganella sp. BJB476]|nr:hypothetical protein D0T21_09415 [Duganella sp. BJB476]